MMAITTELIGMPLGYAISLLREKNIPYILKETKQKSRFFAVDETKQQVIRAVMEGDACVLTVCARMVLTEEVQKMVDITEFDYASEII